MSKLGWFAFAGMLIGCGASGAGRPEDPPEGYPKEDYEAARMAYDRGDYVEAIARAEAAAKVRDTFAPAWVMLGHAHQRIVDSGQRMYSERKHTEYAILYYTRAIDLKPDARTTSEAYYHRAIAYIVIARYQQAIADLSWLTTVGSPKDPRPHMLLGVIEEEKYEGLEAEALAHYEKYAELGGRDPMVLGRLQFLRATAGPATGATTPTTGPPAAGGTEDKAFELFGRLMAAFEAGDVNTQISLVEKLLKDFADTEFVKKRRAQLETALEQLRNPPRKP